MSKKIVLIDGHSILNRAFYALPVLTNSEGLYTNAVLGFLNILFKILDEEKPDYLTIAFDVHQPTFRHEMYAEYKGTRKAMPEELRGQVPLLKEVLKAMKISILEKGGYEADDILGTLAVRAEREGYEVSVVSGDRDLLQLATDTIKIRIPKTKKGGTEIENYNTKDVMETYGVTPKEFIDMKALMGDASDNIPGVPGIGEKTAAKIIMSFSSIENAYAHIDEVTPNKARESMINNREQAYLSKTLATIKTDCEVDYRIEDADYQEIYNEDAYNYFKRLELKSLLNRFSGVNASNAKSKKEEETKFETITGKKKAGEIFDAAVKVSGSGPVGFYLITEGEVLGLALSFGEDTCLLLAAEEAEALSGQDITAGLGRLLAAGKSFATLHLKEQLVFLPEEVREGIDDIAIAAYLLNPLQSSYECDDIARDYLKLTLPSQAEIFGKGSLKEFLKLKKEESTAFFCNYAYTALKAMPLVLEELRLKGMDSLYNTIEMPLVYALYDMEQRGIKVNKEELKEYGDKLTVGINRLEKEIYEMAGEEFNINSPKQLGVILFEKLHLPNGKKTKTGYSTSAEVLEKLQSEEPIVGKILEYRQLTKLKSTYADGLAVYISNDGRIHGKFHQTIAATGRISSTEPNLQNIPIRMELGREIRKVFIPEEGYVFLDADYSQIELRVLAHMSGDERLIEAYKENQDIHRITASLVFHTPFEEVTSEQRRAAKAVNFGIVYGISSFGLGQGLNISRKEAEDYINRYFDTYPGVKTFLDELVNEGKTEGYVTTLYGRRRPIPELTSSNFMTRSFGERVAMNSPIQGTAADIIKIAMIRVNEKLKALKLRSRLILQIHDELLIEAHKEEAEEVRKLLKEEMQNAAELLVTLEVDVNEGPNWYEAK
ncbi:DNA polymerase I [Anaerocolumna xylanovorans]|uniref:DNA polymerase I n=1 Tax=Anaerocolumna xylanovorans DSM 12503 TaxID=1121345 RepID=A0A1M7YB38_9FIRM|nr:DNA polymerase I [Anaerocolumna xylanovorans]SHO49811.1 DNA polymerase I [Anaerocolumna xylanovorans DSM 12503]